MKDFIQKAMKQPLALISLSLALFFLITGLIILLIPELILPGFGKPNMRIFGLILMLYGMYRIFLNYKRIRDTEKK